MEELAQAVLHCDGGDSIHRCPELGRTEGRPGWRREVGRGPDTGFCPAGDVALQQGRIRPSSEHDGVTRSERSKDGLEKEELPLLATSACAGWTASVQEAQKTAPEEHAREGPDHHLQSLNERRKMLVLASLGEWWFTNAAPHVNPTDHINVLWGMLHGVLVLPNLIYSLINQNATIYQAPNDGAGYNIGFFIGMLIIYGGGASRL